MSDTAEMTVTSVTTATTSVHGRILAAARHNHFVIDGPKEPGESISTAEAFFAGVAGCGITLVQGEARRQGIDLQHLQVDISAFKLVEGPPDFDHMEIVFTYTGPSLDQAHRLTEVWKSRCPLYRAIAPSIPNTVCVRLASDGV
jgi:uncharacterized OsmC-like protein